MGFFPVGSFRFIGIWIDKPFYKESYPVGITNLKHMLDVGEILEVERDE